MKNKGRHIEPKKKFDRAEAIEWLKALAPWALLIYQVMRK
jgi:hypothetical protein